MWGALLIRVALPQAKQSRRNLEMKGDLLENSVWQNELVLLYV